MYRLGRVTSNSGIKIKTAMVARPHKLMASTTVVAVGVLQVVQAPAETTSIETKTVAGGIVIVIEVVETVTESGIENVTVTGNEIGKGTNEIGEEINRLRPPLEKIKKRKSENARNVRRRTKRNVDCET